MNLPMKIFYTLGGKSVKKTQCEHKRLNIAVGVTLKSQVSTYHKTKLKAHKRETTAYRAYRLPTGHDITKSKTQYAES